MSKRIALKVGATLALVGAPRALIGPIGMLLLLVLPRLYR